MIGYTAALSGPVWVPRVVADPAWELEPERKTDEWFSMNSNRVRAAVSVILLRCQVHGACTLSNSHLRRIIYVSDQLDVARSSSVDGCC